MKLLSCVQLFATPWAVAYQALLSMRFSRQEYWSRLPFFSPAGLPDPGIKPGFLHCRQTLYQLSYKGSPQRLSLILLNVSSSIFELLKPKPPSSFPNPPQPVHKHVLFPLLQTISKIWPHCTTSITIISHWITMIVSWAQDCLFLGLPWWSNG